MPLNDADFTICQLTLKTKNAKIVAFLKSKTNFEQVTFNFLSSLSFLSISHSTIYLYNTAYIYKTVDVFKLYVKYKILRHHNHD